MKQNIAKRMADKTGSTQVECRKMLEAALQAIIDESKDRRLLKLRGFGTFKFSPIKARGAILDPQGEPTYSPSFKKITFIGSNAFKKKING